MPKDANNDAIYASISEGGLGVPSFLALSKKLKDTRLLNIEGIGDENNGEALARSPSTSKIMRPMYLQKYNIRFNENIYNHLDTKGLEQYPQQIPGYEECMRFIGGTIFRKL